MLTKAVIKARPSVLWCFKKDMEFTSHQKKRIKRNKARGTPIDEKEVGLDKTCES